MGLVFNYPCFNLSNVLIEETSLELRINSRLSVGPVDWLVKSEHRQYVVLEDAEVEEKLVTVPSNSADHCTGHGIENEMVRCGDDGG